jgi:hypothetical protein
MRFASEQFRLLQSFHFRHNFFVKVWNRMTHGTSRDTEILAQSRSILWLGMKFGRPRSGASEIIPTSVLTPFGAHLKSQQPMDPYIAFPARR